MVVGIMMYLLDLEQIAELRFKLDTFVNHPKIYTSEEIDKLCAEIGHYHNHPTIMRLLYTLRLEMEKMCEEAFLCQLTSNQMRAKIPE